MGPSSLSLEDLPILVRVALATSKDAPSFAPTTIMGALLGPGMRFEGRDNPLIFFTLFAGDGEHSLFHFGPVGGGEGDHLISTTFSLAWTAKPTLENGVTLPAKRKPKPAHRKVKR